MTTLAQQGVRSRRKFSVNLPPVRSDAETIRLTVQCVFTNRACSVPLPKLVTGQETQTHPRSEEGWAPNDVIDMVQDRLIEKTKQKRQWSLVGIWAGLGRT
jgi:hypothetical protein